MNVFTRVPNTDPPRLAGIPVPIVWAADVFMVLMISRPRSGSIGRTWVTPSTMWLSAALAVIGTALGIVAIAMADAGGGWATARVVGPAILLWSAGAACVAIVGFAQRRLEQRAGGE